MADETPQVVSKTDDTLPVSDTTPTPPVPQYATVEQFNRLENALTAIAQAFTRPTAPAVPAKAPDEMTDEDLWGLAQQGNRQAFEMYQARIAQREFKSGFQREQRVGTVRAQIAALYQKYPEFTNQQGVLYQRAVAFKQALVGLGADANNQATDLDAMLRAVADSRDEIAPRVTQPARQATPTGQMGAMHRQESAGTEQQPKVSPAEFKLARQMGVKDPGKAVKKFWERQENGASSVSPTVVAAVREQQ